MRRPRAVFDECDMLHAGELRKKYNLTRDPASWLGYQAALRTDDRSIGIVVLRRKCTNVCLSLCIAFGFRYVRGAGFVLFILITQIFRLLASRIMISKLFPLGPC